MRRIRVLLGLGAFVSFVTVLGCEGFVMGWPARERAVVHEPGPPPHAPAHGHRRKHASGCDLRFDSQLGVYVVLGRSNLYFHDGLFVRFEGDSWQISANLGGPWAPSRERWVPDGLRAKHHAKAKKKHHHAKAKNKHEGRPAKHDW